MRRNQRCLLVFVSLTGVLLASIHAAKVAEASSRSPAPPAQGATNEECLACHAIPGLETELPGGDTLYLTIDQESYRGSVHGELGYACVQCHTDITEFPHDPITAPTRRAFTLQLYTACVDCHQDKYTATLDSVHQEALATGSSEAAVCTDCHGAHNVGDPEDPRSRVPHTCEQCHSQIYGLYEESIHGDALIGEGNPDVPTCTDCHGVHDVEGPSTSAFHLFSPQICAQCHTDAKLMEPYGLSTDVMETYVSDFHGTTVVLFEKIAPDQETNKPVCIDCHGVHDIRHTHDPESTVIKMNLLTTCQKCHPDATTNFPTSWLSHYRPSREHSPLVYYVTVFYAVLIPAMIGGMLVFNFGDAARRLLGRREERRHE